MRNYRNRTTIFVFALLLLLLVGCAEGESDEPIVTAMVEVSTVTPEPKETAVPTMTATTTQIPTLTATVTPTAEKIVSEKYQEYIGLIDPVEVPDIAGAGGMLLSNGQSEPMYALAVTVIGDDILMIFERNTTPHRTKNHEWEILDILAVPYGQTDKVFVVESCYKNDEWVRNVVGIVVLDDEAYINRWVPNEGILSLWFINRELERFEVVADLTGYECSPESGFMIGPSSRTSHPERAP